MKGGVTKKIQDTVTALDQKQLKKALYLTDHTGLERQHAWVEEAARTCLANKGKGETCKVAIKGAREKVQETINLPIEDTSLEGLEKYLSPESKPEQAEVKQPEGQPSTEMTDEELYESCEECHVAVAAERIARICAERPEEAGRSCELIYQKVADENTEPVDWIKAMVETAEQAQGETKEEMVAAVTELTDYLERRNSPFLKGLDEEEKP